MRKKYTLIVFVIVSLLSACCSEKKNKGYNIYMILSGKHGFTLNEDVSVYYNEEKIGEIEQLSFDNNNVILSATIDEAVLIPQGSFFEVNNMLSPGLSNFRIVIIPSSVMSEFYNPGDSLVEFKSAENYIFMDSAVIDSLDYYINEIRVIIEEQI